MKSYGLIACFLLLFVSLLGPAISGHPGLNFVKQAFQGSGDMLRAYNDMRQANWKGADKYFHARGNYDAAKRGLGGVLAAKHLSNAREAWQGSISGRGAQDSRADQVANNWGRNGGNPNFFRPPGLPSKY